MLNKKIGISIPWFLRTNSLDIWKQEKLKSLIKNLFLKQNIFISDIYYQEYPKAIYFIINIFPIQKKQYYQIIILYKILRQILIFLTKKNIIINFKIASNLYENIDILIEWLNLKLYNEPTKTKKLLKLILKQYDTIIK